MNFFRALYLLALLPAACGADSLAVNSKTRYASELSNLPIGCRTIALGDAGVALPLDASSAFYNPGALPFLSNHQVLLEYADLYNGLSSQVFGALCTQVQKDVVLAVLYSGFYSGAMAQNDTLPGTLEQRIQDPTLRADGSSTGLFYNYQNLIIVPLAKRFNLPLPRVPGFSYPLPCEVGLGLNFKGYWQTFNIEQKVRMGLSLNLDLGAMLRFGLDYDLRRAIVSREINLGIAVRDALPTRVSWVGSPENYQESVARSELFGIAYIDRSG
ncbi:MAG: hypothetical protein PHC61_06180, partial [Chitinivibrionales bacterium]|nr:hypothetical protein [Chitinivibrionales bacterium]